MIYDSITNKEKYKDNTELYTVLNYLASITENNYPSTKVELNNDDIFINPVQLTTKLQEQCIYEAHKNYCDVHFILSGIEGIAVTDVRQLKEQIPYDTQKDIGFYTGKVPHIYYLKQGDFMYCLPEDAHMVAIMQEQPSPVKKLVGKIRVQ